MELKTIESDLVVVGGGLAGTMAAVAAKRTNPNMTVWLLEQYGFLGGMATAGYVYPFMRYYTHPRDNVKSKRLSGGLFYEMMETMHKLGYCEEKARGNNYARFDPMMIRCVLDKMVLDEEVKILFHTIVNKIDTEISDNGKRAITKIYAQTKAGEYIFIPKMVIDATGDADVVFHAGGTTFTGREEDGLGQPGTLNFRMGNIGIIQPGRHYITKKIIEEKTKGNPLTPRDDCLKFVGNTPNQFHYNQTRVAGYDFTDPMQMSEAEIEGRRQAERFIQFLRKNVIGYKKATVVGLGTQLGIRETRRILGEYTLTDEDLMSFKMFEDRIALGNYPIDIHDPKGSASTDIRRVPEGKFYSIPYRSLIPKGFDNVLVAGRPISSNHVAHSAIRVMPICTTIGHAAGVACGIKSKENQSNSFTDLPIPEIQEILRKQKAILE